MEIYNYVSRRILSKSYFFPSCRTDGVFAIVKRIPDISAIMSDARKPESPVIANAFRVSGGHGNGDRTALARIVGRGDRAPHGDSEFLDQGEADAGAAG